MKTFSRVWGTKTSLSRFKIVSTYKLSLYIILQKSSVPGVHLKSRGLGTRFFLECGKTVGDRESTDLVFHSRPRSRVVSDVPTTRRT